MKPSPDSAAENIERGSGIAFGIPYRMMSFGHPLNPLIVA